MEILAPAGSVEALKKAVYSHADAVYLGLENFNARIKADNFTTENIKSWVEFCHLFGVKVYLTLNTNVKERELDEVESVVLIAKDAHIDAFIVTDMAVVDTINRLAPTIAMHASTQLGIHNVYGAKIAEKLGFKRVVLARETTIDEIKDIKKNTSLEIEYFIHGALCVSFSGGCLFSSIIGGNSGNRGRCLQPCRKLYTNSFDGSEGYFLSPKDQCLISELDRLRVAGVDSIKIEGRMKSPEYVATVVGNYYKVLHGKKLNDDDNYRMLAVFNRGEFTKGYSFDRTREIIFPSVQGHFGANVGELVASKKLNSGKFLLTAKLTREIPDKCGIKFIRAGREVGGMELDIQELEGDIVTFISINDYTVGTEIHVTNDPSIVTDTDMTWKLPIDISYVAKLGRAFELTLTYRDTSIVYTSEFLCAPASSRPLTQELINKQLLKLGDTYFASCDIEGDIDDNIFIPNNIINEARRMAVERLSRTIIENFERKNVYIHAINEITIPNNTLEERDIIELDRASDIGQDTFAYAVNYSRENVSILKNRSTENSIYLKLPKLAVNVDLAIITKSLAELPLSIGIYADNVYALELAIESNRKVILGFGLNIYNNVARRMYGNSNNICASVELNREELKNFDDSAYVYYYGYLPLMTFAHCPYQVATGRDCNDCDYKDFSYNDKYGDYKITRTRVNKCTFTLNNCACHDLREEEVAKKYYDFRHLDSQEIAKFLNDNELVSEVKRTLGHYSRGVQ